MLIPHTFAFKHGYLFKHIFLFFFFNFVTMNNKAHTEHQSVSKKPTDTEVYITHPCSAMKNYFERLHTVVIFKLTCKRIV